MMSTSQFVGFLIFVFYYITSTSCLLPKAVVNVDYCRYNKFCPKSSQHIACTYPRSSLASICPPAGEITFTDFTSKRINLVLDTHNSYRNIVAAGLLEGYPKAARMLSLHWEDELAYFSEANTRQCVMKHDKCRNSSKYSYVGQNVCHSYSVNRTKPEKVITDCIDLWFLESQSVLNPRGIIDSCCLNPKPYPLVVGHFTQLVNDRSNAIGCALMTFKQNDNWSNLFVCDYSSGNVVGFPVYRYLKLNSECKRFNPKYPALCHPDEPNDPNLLLQNQRFINP